MSYKKYLQKNETLDLLVDRLKSQKELEGLIEDLLLDKLDDLNKFEYLHNDRFCSSEESAFNWLLNSPFYIKKVSTSVIESHFVKSIEQKNNLLTHKTLSITNINKIGIGYDVLYKVLNENISDDLRIRIYLTIYSIEKESLNNMETYVRWKEKLSDSNFKYQHIVLISIFSKQLSDKAIESFLEYDKTNPEKVNAEIGKYLFNGLVNTIVNFFDKPDSIPNTNYYRVQFFVDLCESLDTVWLRELIIKVFELSELQNIVEDILLNRPHFIDNLRIPSIETLVEYTKKYSSMSENVESNIIKIFE